MTKIDEAWLAERERIRRDDPTLPWRHRDPGVFVDSVGDEVGCVEWAPDADLIVDAVNHQPALIAEIRRLRLLVMEAFDAASLAASTHIDYDPDAAHQAVREARAAVVAKLEARKLHPEFERLEQKFDPRGPTPPWFVGGGA